MSSTTDCPLVLVVEDFADTREMYAEYLRFCGFRVAEVGDGRAALTAATELLPDLILMDLALPEMDGWEATRRLKRDQRTKNIPVVALTGHALAGHVESAKESGCDAFIAKPCLPDDLVTQIRRVLAREAHHHHHVDHPATPRATAKRSKTSGSRSQAVAGGNERKTRSDTAARARTAPVRARDDRRQRNRPS